MYLSDEELFQRIQDRDQAAFDELYTRYASSLRLHLLRMLRDQANAEDVLQEVFLRVWTQANTWNGRGSVRGWLFRIATNQALNQLRSIRRRRQEPLEPASRAEWQEDDQHIPSWLIDSMSPGPDILAERAEQHATLRSLITQLSDAQRSVLRMIHEQDMEISEVAQALNIPSGTVKSRLHYATRRLAAQFKDDY